MLVTPTYQSEIPIFPLGVVAMPGVEVPLHIFEARYRVLFNTLLQGEDGLEEGLIDATSPYAGTKQFGMCFLSDQGMCRVGSLLEIERHEMLAGGRMLIVSTGVKRFRVVNVLKARPVLMAEVEWFEEETDEQAEADEEVRELGTRVSSLIKDTLRLGYKAKGIEPPPEAPAQLDTLGPRMLSFWVPSLFDTPLEQQAMLEMDSTKKRLERERDLLQQTLDYLSARIAIKGAFDENVTGESPFE
eukprot:jgi/Mesvir1/5688/Mv15703-RA.1